MAGAKTDSDVEKNKIFAILAYLGILVLVPLLAAKDSKFARYHTNQGLVLFIGEIIAWFVGMMLALVSFGLLGVIIFPLLFLVILIFVILGIINAAQGEMKPLPVIGGIEILK